MRLFLLSLSVLVFLLPIEVQAKTKHALQTVSFQSELPTEGNLVLGIYQNDLENTYLQIINLNSNDGLTHAIESLGFKGKQNSTQLITAPQGSNLQQILLVGLGEKSADKSDLDWQKIGDTAIQSAVGHFKQAPALVFDVNANALAQITFGANLGSYYFDKYYTNDDRKKTQQNLTLINKKSAESKAIYEKDLKPVAEAIRLTRDVSNEPANVIFPESFVARWKKHFKGMDNIRIRVLDEEDMLKKGMGAIYGVGRGSDKPPRMMIVEYMGGKKDDNPIVIVGKGITFDTGGISIKGKDNMWNMKNDMSGAASTMGTIHALAGRGAKVNVVGIAALAENMPGGNAQRPGDVVQSMSGLTIQIRSTDAEGRLVLADAVYYGDRTYNPPLLIDLATLTGSASRALGKDYAALFSRHDELLDKIIESGKDTGEEVWPLPLNKSHFKAIENNVADIMNSGPTAPGASAGAAFIGTFIRDTTLWAHLDIAGVAYTDQKMPFKASPGSRSFGVRLLNSYIKKHYETNVQ